MTMGPDLAPAQFGAEGQATGVALAICGPVAAIAFARATGRAPTVAEALDLARDSGLWDEGTGMHGPAAEQALLTHMGVKSRLDTAPSPDDVIRDVQGGNPVILSSPGHYHYFVVTGYDPSTGLFDTGNTGEALRGGSRWRTWEDIGPQAALYIDEPTSPTPSVAVQPQQFMDAQRPAAPYTSPTAQVVQQATAGEDPGVQQNILQQALGTVEGTVSDAGNAALGAASGVGNAALGVAGTALDYLDRPNRAVRSMVQERIDTNSGVSDTLQAGYEGLTGQRDASYTDMVLKANPALGQKIPDWQVRAALAPLGGGSGLSLANLLFSMGGVTYAQAMGAAATVTADPLNALELLGVGARGARLAGREGVAAIKALGRVAGDIPDIAEGVRGVTSPPVRGPLEESLFGLVGRGGPALAGGAEDVEQAVIRAGVPRHLIPKIRELLAQGVPEAQIRRDLAEAGWGVTAEAPIADLASARANQFAAPPTAASAVADPLAQARALRAAGETVSTSRLQREFGIGYRDVQHGRVRPLAGPRAGWREAARRRVGPLPRGRPGRRVPLADAQYRQESTGGVGRTHARARTEHALSASHVAHHRPVGTVRRIARRGAVGFCAPARTLLRDAGPRHPDARNR
jgi:hypothetical protein